MNEITWNEYKVRRLSMERLNDLAILFRDVYGRDLQQKYFWSKYKTAYTGVAYTGHLAYDAENNPVAFFGAIPCFITHDGNKILAAQAVDAMTHPSHRSKGLFVALANLTIELCRNEGIRILFGFPNQHSLPGLVDKLQWHLTGYLSYFTFPVRALPIEQFVFKLPILKGIYNRYIAHQLKKYTLPQKISVQSCTGSGIACVYRDNDYLEYKTYNHTATIKIQDVSLWLKVNNGLTVGDMTMPADFENTIHRLKLLASKLGLRQVMFQVSEHTPLHNLLEKFTLAHRGFTVVIKDMGSGIPADKLKFTFADIDIF